MNAFFKGSSAQSLSSAQDVLRQDAEDIDISTIYGGSAVRSGNSSIHFPSELKLTRNVI